MHVFCFFYYLVFTAFVIQNNDLIIYILANPQVVLCYEIKINNSYFSDLN